MSMSKLVNVNNIQQLVDLNGELTNFKLDFKVISENSVPFKTVVISQSKLDSGEILDFKNVDNGTISGNIVSDNGVKQNYYLILKSENPVKCTVEINLQEIPLNENIKRKQQEYQNQLLQEQEYQQRIFQEKENSMNQKKLSKKSEGFFNLKTILFLLVIACGIIFYYLFYIRNKNQVGLDAGLSIIDNRHMFSENIDLPVISSNTLNLSNEINPIFNNINENLLSRLNNIQMY
jgi:hypothetical protein